MSKIDRRCGGGWFIEEGKAAQGGLTLIGLRDGLGREALVSNEQKTGCVGTDVSWTEGQEKMRESQNLGHRSPST